MPNEYWSEKGCPVNQPRTGRFNMNCGPYAEKCVDEMALAPPRTSHPTPRRDSGSRAHEQCEPSTIVKLAKRLVIEVPTTVFREIRTTYVAMARAHPVQLVQGT